MKIQESLEKQAPECLVQLLVQNLNAKKFQQNEQIKTFEKINENR